MHAYNIMCVILHENKSLDNSWHNQTMHQQHALDLKLLKSHINIITHINIYYPNHV